jgi:hypothetical protein
MFVDKTEFGCGSAALRYPLLAPRQLEASDPELQLSDDPARTLPDQRSLPFH